MIEDRFGALSRLVPVSWTSDEADHKLGRDVQDDMNDEREAQQQCQALDGGGVVVGRVCVPVVVVL